MNEKWDRRFLTLAKQIAGWSKDPSTKVGAVIADKKRIVSLGYNGFATGCEDSRTRLAIRELKYPRIIHAEVNAIIWARGHQEGCTIYTYPFMPCSSCASVVVNAGITRVVSFLNVQNPRWTESFRISNEIFNEANVKVDLYENEHP